MQRGLVSKNASASIRRHGNSSAIPNREQKQHQKVDHRSHGLVSQRKKVGYTGAGREGFGERPSLRTGRTIRIAWVPP
jgi:hypothetical protein